MKERCLYRLTTGPYNVTLLGFEPRLLALPLGYRVILNSITLSFPRIPLIISEISDVLQVLLYPHCFGGPGSPGKKENGLFQHYPSDYLEAFLIQHKLVYIDPGQRTWTELLVSVPVITS